MKQKKKKKNPFAEAAHVDIYLNKTGPLLAPQKECLQQDYRVALHCKGFNAGASLPTCMSGLMQNSLPFFSP